MSTPRSIFANLLLLQHSSLSVLNADYSLREDAVYLSQPVTTDIPEMFWISTQSNDFPTLRCLAVKLLSIPATSASAECSSSVAEAIIRAYRNKLSTPTVESVLLCIQVTE